MPTEMIKQSPWMNSIRLLKTKRFGTFWFANFLSNIGTWTQQVAQPWLLLSLGASPFILGLDGLALGAPVWVLTLLGGVLADRADRRKIIANLQFIQMLCPLFLVGLLLENKVEPWMVVALSLIIGITDALSMPSFQTIVSSIVSKEQVPAGLALNSTQFNLTRIIGPAIAGVLLVSIGAIGCFAVSAISYIPFILVALWVLPKHIPKPHDKNEYDRQLFSGVLEVLKNPYLRGGLLTVLLSGILCGPVITFSSILVKSIFLGNAVDFSISMSSFGLGAVIGACCLLFISPHHDRRMIASFCAISFGASLILIGLNPWNSLLPILMVVAGFSMIITNISVNTLIQTRSSELLRGQAISLFLLASRGGIGLGAFLTGMLVGLLGVKQALIFNGVLAIILQSALFLTWIKKRNLS